MDRQVADCRAELERTYGAALPGKLAMLNQWIDHIDRVKPGFRDFVLDNTLTLNRVLMKIAICLAERRK